MVKVIFTIDLKQNGLWFVPSVRENVFGASSICSGTNKNSNNISRSNLKLQRALSPLEDRNHNKLEGTVVSYFSDF